MSQETILDTLKEIDNKGTSGLLSSVTYDYVSVSYPDSVTEAYSFKSGGASGTVTATITLVYTDSTKASLSTVTRT